MYLSGIALGTFVPTADCEARARAGNSESGPFKYGGHFCKELCVCTFTHTSSAYLKVGPLISGSGESVLSPLPIIALGKNMMVLRQWEI